MSCAAIWRDDISIALPVRTLALAEEQLGGASPWGHLPKLALQMSPWAQSQSMPQHRENKKSLCRASKRLR